MELVRTDLRELDGYQRLVGLVRYQDGTEESGNMWVATLLPLAAMTGEPMIAH